jgi:hypothetical protein
MLQLLYSFSTRFKVKLSNLCDIDTIMGLPYNLPMLEYINALMKCVHARNVFVCD